MGVRRRKLQEFGENYVVRSFIIFAPYQAYQNHQVKYNEMDRACSMCGERIKTCSAAFGCSDLNEGNHVGNLDVWERLMSVQK